jgi:hypothetical protein
LTSKPQLDIIPFAAAPFSIELNYTLEELANRSRLVGVQLRLLSLPLITADFLSIDQQQAVGHALVDLVGRDPHRPLET